MKIKEPTTTSLVLEALRADSGFMDYVALRVATCRNVNQISAACFHLRSYRSIDVVIDNGIGWWYALPPELDTRHDVRDQRTPEVKPRNKRSLKARRKEK